MEPPPLPTSMKRVLTTDSMIDSSVVQIAPSGSRSRKSRKQKQLSIQEVIELDNDEDSADVVAIEGKVDAVCKGKAVVCVSDSLSEQQNKNSYIDVDKYGSKIGVDIPTSLTPGLHKSSNIVDHTSYLYCDDNFDFGADAVFDTDKYAFLQAQFDSMDAPPGVEVTIPWLTDHAQDSKIPAHESSVSHTRSAMEPNSMVPFHMFMDPTLMSRSGFQASANGLGQSPTMQPSSPMLLPHHKTKGKFSVPQSIGYGMNSFSRSHQIVKYLKNKAKLHAQSSSAHSHLTNQFSDYKNLPNGANPYLWGYNSHAPGVEPYMPWWGSYENDPFNGSQTIHSGYHDLMNDAHIPPEEADIPLVPDISNCHFTAVSGSAATSSLMDVDDTLKKYQLFKQFDTVEDSSDHHYAPRESKQRSKNWAKRIQDDWKILEKGLPDTIFVRVYESRMDLLRAVIVGAEGTPYHDGLFFFDVYFPSGYPNVPPNVYYHSGGLRLNPNLYACGKVCLSLLNTWSGGKNEKWRPSLSTMLQVLVSIQGLILNSKPYFNEPGFAHTSGTQNGEMASEKYNESTFLLSLKTMLYTMRRPPKHFEDFVLGHFCNRARDILVSCKAYMDGAQVGCLVKGGVQDVDEGDKSCSQEFKQSVAGYVDVLVKDFTRIGAKDCQKFQSQTNVGAKVVSSLPTSGTCIKIQ